VKGSILKVGDLVMSHHWAPGREYAIVTKVHERDDYDYYDIIFIESGFKVSRSHCDMEVISESW